MHACLAMPTLCGPHWLIGWHPPVLHTSPNFQPKVRPTNQSKWAWEGSGTQNKGVKAAHMDLDNNTNKFEVCEALVCLSDISTDPKPLHFRPDG